MVEKNSIIPLLQVGVNFRRILFYGRNNSVLNHGVGFTKLHERLWFHAPKTGKRNHFPALEQGKFGSCIPGIDY
jgi:hypothetical protein